MRKFMDVCCITVLTVMIWYILLFLFCFWFLAFGEAKIKVLMPKFEYCLYISVGWPENTLIKLIIYYFTNFFIPISHVFILEYYFKFLFYDYFEMRKITQIRDEMLCILYKILRLKMKWWHPNIFHFWLSIKVPSIVTSKYERLACDFYPKLAFFPLVLKQYL